MNKNSQSIEKEETLTFEDVLKGVNNEILAVSKIEKNDSMKSCTYNKGYITQEIFACQTCYNEKEVFGALCVGCAYSCHKDHEIYQLYFKRKVRCDCGNSKYVSICSLITEKDYENDKNEYNHNYENRYCFCNSDEDGEMAQCIICEDWFHSTHLQMDTSSSMHEGDLICRLCLQNRLAFLEDYPIDTFLYAKQNAEKTQDDETEYSIQKAKKTDNKKDTEKQTEVIVNIEELISNNIHSDEQLPKEFCKRISFSSEKTRSAYHSIKDKDIMIIIKDFANILCQCSKCKELYVSLSIAFLSESDYCEDWWNRTLLEDKISKEVEEDSEENQVLLSQINSANMYNLMGIRNLQMEKARYRYIYQVTHVQ